jgi:hypothetical protein
MPGKPPRENETLSELREESEKDEYVMSSINVGAEAPVVV